MKVVNVEELQELLQRYLASMSKFNKADSHEIMVNKVLMRQGAEEICKVVASFLNNKGE